MKKLLRAILSLCLIAACIFALLTAYSGLQDVLNIQDYKTADGDMAREGIAAARDGLAQLMENETTYTDGVAQYNDGVAQLADGAAQLADGEAQLADGKAQIAANTDRYNEGKALLEKIDPIMPYVQQYIQWRDSGLASAPGFPTFQTWFVNVVAPVISSVGLEIPSDVSDFPAWFNAYVEDGHAQLKQYEDGLVQIEEGEAQLAEGYAQYADGQKQLAEGDAQLKVFEDGEGQIADGMNQLMEGMEACYRYRSGKQTAKSLAERLGPDWQLYKLNADGSRVQYRGVDFVDFENCVKLCDEGEAYLDDQEKQIGNELYGRLATLGCMGVAAVLGLIAGLLGLIAAFTNKRRNGFGFGLWGTILSVAGIIIGIIKKWTDQIYLCRDDAGVYTYTYDGVVKALIILACLLALFTLVSAIARKSAPKKVKAGKGATKTADQIYASAVSDHSKDAEIARLREELADLRAKKPDTYKE